jgi:hypothetical protein
MTVANPVNNRCNLLFSHPQVGSITVDTGADEIGWAYNLNTANFPTFGGEVVQILSVYIDDLLVKGTIRTYTDMEEIYNFFASYMLIATQGSKGVGSYDQTPMTMTYSPRQWTFSIQPIGTPGFTYDRETVAPQWQLQAHIVDNTPDVEALKDMVVTQVLNGEDNQNFALSGIISPDSGDPANNPFSAPGTTQGNTFKPLTEAQTQEDIGKYADYYNSLIPSYMKGDYESVFSEIGSKPAFGTTSAPTKGEQSITGATQNK